MSDPTASKAAEIPSAIPTRPGKYGGRLRTGNPGGGGGRPRDAFKQLCRELASGEQTVENVRAILGDPKHQLFLGALKWATEHGYGKATEKVELSGADGGPIQQVIKIGDKVIAF